MKRTKNMNTIRNIFQAIKTTLKFLWRHCLTLIVFSMAIHAFIFSTPILSRVLETFLITLFIDWVKMKIKLTPNCNRLGATTPTLQSQNPFNYNMVGTASYLSNIGHH